MIDKEKTNWEYSTIFAYIFFYKKKKKNIFIRHHRHFFENVLFRILFKSKSIRPYKAYK